MGVDVVVGFTGSSIWQYVAMFPPVPAERIEAGYRDFADRWNPILDVFDECGVRFAHEVHPSEIAYDYWSTARALEAIDHRPAFGINWDPSHMVWQGLDPVAFITDFADRIYHVDCKDTRMRMGGGRNGILSSHLPWGDQHRGWDFVSTGRGQVPWEDAFRALARIGYDGPISVEWEDAGMDRLRGAPGGPGVRPAVRLRAAQRIVRLRLRPGLRAADRADPPCRSSRARLTCGVPTASSRLVGRSFALGCRALPRRNYRCKDGSGDRVPAVNRPRRWRTAWCSTCACLLRVGPLDVSCWPEGWWGSPSSSALTRPRMDVPSRTADPEALAGLDVTLIVIEMYVLLARDDLRWPTFSAIQDPITTADPVGRFVAGTACTAAGVGLAVLSQRFPGGGHGRLRGWVTAGLVGASLLHWRPDRWRTDRCGTSSSPRAGRLRESTIVSGRLVAVDRLATDRGIPHARRRRRALERSTSLGRPSPMTALDLVPGDGPLGRARMWSYPPNLAVRGWLFLSR